MSRIASRFDELRQARRKALVPYITAGDPEPGVTVDLMHALVAAGADLIELGVPFSDPMADGPVIQAAHERALAHGVSLRQVLDMVAAFRRDDGDTPLVLMGYLNPVEAMGYAAFAEAAAAAGVDGVLVVDAPPEESATLVTALRAAGLDQIFLTAPTSDAERLRRIAAVASGFVYYVSLKGVTGAATLDVADVAARVADIRAFIDLPIGVGFGIRDARSAERIARLADAVVVGSAIVARMAEHADDRDALLQEVSRFVAGLRVGMDNASTTEEVA